MRKKKYYLVGLSGLIIVWAIIFAAAEGIRRLLGPTASQSLNIALTGGLSLALVFLYFRQTQILDSQRDLLTQELNHEARRQHTETLKKRIRLWHGDPDREEPENLLDVDDLNIPRISGTDIETARAGGFYLAGDDSFSVIPQKLQNDRYLDDFIKNHAPDIRDTVENITELRNEYVSQREDFTFEGFSPQTFNEEDYHLYPSDRIEEWIFRQVVLVNRGLYEDIDEVVNRLPKDIDNATGHARTEEGLSFIPVRDNEAAVYIAESQRDGYEGIKENRKEIEQRVIRSVQQLLRELETSSSYDYALQGARTFEDAAIAITRLEQLLIEYEGRPIIQGDCEYLREAKIGE